VNCLHSDHSEGTPACDIYAGWSRTSIWWAARSAAPSWQSWPNHLTW